MFILSENTKILDIIIANICMFIYAFNCIIVSLNFIKYYRDINFNKYIFFLYFLHNRYEYFFYINFN